MMATSRSCWFAALFALAACGSVDVPRERFYRLEVPAAATPDASQGGVLRVQDLQLATALDSDCLMRVDGVQLSARPLARWIAPLDRLVTDALVLGLSRARVCELVKGGGDPGGEHWTLRGRIVDFVEADGGSGPEARVAIELWLEADGRVLLHDEFAAQKPMADRSADAAVLALSEGLRSVVAEVVARMQRQDLFAKARAAATDGADAAAVPGR